jgi:L,D-peptidoglycan transpeptidase YkuD (ErfK/YbiS/YcfS/YnhG family)
MNTKNLIPASLLLLSTLAVAPASANAQEKPGEQPRDPDVIEQVELFGGKIRLIVKYEELEIPQEKITVAANNLNVRETPSKKSKAHFQLFRGMEITPTEVKEINDEVWVKIQVGDAFFWVAGIMPGSAPFLLEQDEDGKANLPEAKEKVEGHKIIILKSLRQLVLMEAKDGQWTFSKLYPIGLGAGAEKDISPKQEEGDGLTPQGKYYISLRNPSSAFGEDPDIAGGDLTSLQISYPNMFDAWRGLQDGLIPISQYKQIVARVQGKKSPPQKTPLGGDIMIHGGGTSDWTAGCVAMENEDMKELARIVKVGEPVEIW